MQHEQVVAYRRKFGNNWLTSFEDLEIPWRQLTLQEFLDYTDLFNSGLYTEVEVEDEIFSAAVLDPIYVENIDILPAGTISVVVSQILQVSGPDTIEAINRDLNIARQEVGNFLSSLIPLICIVFPAYKPEDLFKLSYQELLKRAAMAEPRLLALRIINEPFSAIMPGQEPPVVEAPEKPSEKKRREILEKKFADLNKKSEVKVDPNSTVITKSKMSPAGDYFPDGTLSKNPEDYLVNQKKIQQERTNALQGLETIYPEYFKMMKEGKKITPDTIKSAKGNTPEEIKKYHEQYLEKVKSGEIKAPQPKKTIIEEKPKKVKVHIKRG